MRICDAFTVYVGEYLGLTGARLNGKELVAVGLATHFVPLEVSLMDNNILFQTQIIKTRFYLMDDRTLNLR